MPGRVKRVAGGTGCKGRQRSIEWTEEGTRVLLSSPRPRPPHGDNQHSTPTVAEAGGFVSCPGRSTCEHTSFDGIIEESSRRSCCCFSSVSFCNFVVQVGPALGQSDQMTSRWCRRIVIGVFREWSVISANLRITLKTPWQLN